MDKKKGKSSNEAKVEDGVPEAKYTRFGERIRQAIPGPMQCSVGCGGRNCKWENPARWSDEDQAIKGVFSSWVLENVVAMSRPSTEIIKKYKMMEQFKTHNICSIINLQRPGEHASCGPPLDKESLFTYRPQDFMDNDIFFYNFGWKDYGVTSLHTVLDMVKVMDFALEEGKVAVHCHAGLGRTGVLIACYLVYAHRMDPGAAILRVRKKRSNSIQTRGQISCIHDFWQFLRPLRVVFPQVVPKSTRLTLKQFLARQRHLLHGFEARELRHTPKLIHVICKRLSQIANGEVEEESEKTEEEVLLDIPIRRCRTVAEIRETLPRAFVNESLQEPQREFKTLPHSESDSKNKTTLLSPRVLRGESTLSSDASADGITEEIQADKKISVEDREARNSKKLKGENCNDQISTDETGEKANGQDSYNKLNSNFKGVEYVDGDILEKSPDTTSETLFVEKTIATETSEKETDNDMMDESEQIARDVNEILELNPRNINNNHSTIDNAQKMLKKKENLGVGEGEDNSEEKSRVLLSDNSPHPPHPDAGVKSLVLNQVASMKPSINPDTDSQTQHSAQVRKMRFSASQSETILPTGSPMKNPRGSAKGRKVVPDLHANSQKNEDEDHTPDGNNSGQKDPAAFPSSDADANISRVDNRTERASLNENEDAGVELKVTCGSDVSQRNSQDNATSATDVSLEQCKPAFNEVEKNNEKYVSISVKPKRMLMLGYNEVVSKFDEVKEQERSDAVEDDNEVFANNVPASAEDDSNYDPALLPSTDTARSVTLLPSIVIDADTSKDNVQSTADTSSENKIDETVRFEIGAYEMEDDDNLDEIIDIRNDDDPFLSDSDLENEDVGDRRTSSGQALSNSVASRVSWGRMKQASKANYSDDSTANTTNDDDYRGVSASSKASRTSGRRTPLMYRAEKNMELMEAGEGDVPDEEKLVEDEKLNNSDDSIYFDKSSEEFQMKEDELKGDEERCLLDGSLLGSELIVPMPYIPRINSTKSLNDLSSGLRVDLNSAISRSSSSGDVRHLSPAILAKQDPITVALAFANKLVDDEWLWEKVYTLQRHINSCNDAWDIVSADTDADLLAALMWSWIEHLSDPLLTPKDVGRMMTLLNRDNSDPLSKMPQQVVDVFETTLRSFDQEVNKTVMCLLSCITCFPPLPRKIAESMVHRTVVALIHTSLSSDSADIYRDLEQAFQYYVDAKFKVLNRKRFREDSIEKKQPVEIRTIYRAESSNSDIKSIGEIINKQSAALTIEPSPLPRSGGSVRSSASSGSSNTGNVTMISPRIVVN